MALRKKLVERNKVEWEGTATRRLESFGHRTERAAKRRKPDTSLR